MKTKKNYKIKLKPLSPSLKEKLEKAKKICEDCKFIKDTARYPFPCYKHNNERLMAELIHKDKVMVRKKQIKSDNYDVIVMGVDTANVDKSTWWGLCNPDYIQKPKTSLWSRIIRDIKYGCRQLLP